MKVAKKRYHKKIPQFWNILKGETKEDLTRVGYKGRIINETCSIYCPYIPIYSIKTNK